MARRRGRARAPRRARRCACRGRRARRVTVEEVEEAGADRCPLGRARASSGARSTTRPTAAPASSSSSAAARPRRAAPGWRLGTAPRARCWPRPERARARRACSPRSPTRPAARSSARSPARAGLTASRLAGELPITRQAIAKHLSALRAPAWSSADREGRETRYRLTPEPLDDAIEWMDDVGAAVGRRALRAAQRAGAASADHAAAGQLGELGRRDRKTACGVPAAAPRPRSRAGPRRRACAAAPGGPAAARRRSRSRSRRARSRRRRVAPARRTPPPPGFVGAVGAGHERQYRLVAAAEDQRLHDRAHLGPDRLRGLGRGTRGVREHAPSTSTPRARSAAWKRSTALKRDARSARARRPRRPSSGKWQAAMLPPSFSSSGGSS